MNNLTKTLAVLTLAAGSLGLAQTAAAKDRLTVIYSSGGYYAPPSLYWSHRPHEWRHNRDYGYRHSHAYQRHHVNGHKHRHHDRHDRHDRHYDKWSRHGFRDDRRHDGYRDDGHHDRRMSHSAYGKVSRY
jgi:hypothetical protein